MKWLKNIIPWLKPKVNATANFYAKYDDIIAKGIKPAVHQAVKMGYVDPEKEDKLIKEIEEGMKKADIEIEKRQIEKGKVWT